MNGVGLIHRHSNTSCCKPKSKAVDVDAMYCSSEVVLIYLEFVSFRIKLRIICFPNDGIQVVFGDNDVLRNPYGTIPQGT